MDPGWFELLKGVSPLTILVISGLAIWGASQFRKMLRADTRADLGLRAGETLDKKINDSVSQGFSASVGPLTTAINALSTDLAVLRKEQEGQRMGLTDHGTEIQFLKLQVAALTGQVGGLPAVHALRARIDRKRAEVAARERESST